MKKNQVKKIHIFIIKCLENKRQLSQMAQHIIPTHGHLTDGDSHHAVLFSFPYSVIEGLDQITRPVIEHART